MTTVSVDFVWVHTRFEIELMIGSAYATSIHYSDGSWGERESANYGWKTREELMRSIEERYGLPQIEEKDVGTYVPSENEDKESEYPHPDEEYCVDEEYEEYYVEEDCEELEFDD